MANVKFPGLEEYEKKLAKLGKNATKVAGAAVYKGAGIVADEVREQIKTIPISFGYGTPEAPIPAGVTPWQKQGLLDGMGVSPMENDKGYINVKIGFDGYNKTKTEQYPQGQPNQLIARAVESGTSFRQKSPFIRPAIRNSQARAEEAMAKVIDDEIEKIMD